ncbi:LysR family transcriptional regulator [Actinokineospora bangkokensis]|uniref:LysR family transcriptional regulator n=1 Tax=Actinokineospora bangkokensis TaxID=1193682 RepID=A0A1Q9LLS2_9PSEU|nr:LysR family transcriptional regulator [Actinokineospora bangkokensis]OLR92982.1 LysR family transcriptional regulator [Actinokineospora bangkokensis]
MPDLETRELRYFVAVAEELHFGRAAVRLGIAQPPLSRAIRQLEKRLGVQLLDRDRRGVALTDAGKVLLREAGPALDAVAAAARRTRRAAVPQRSLVLTTKAGAAHDLLRALLDAYAREPGAVPVEVLPCEIGEQAKLLRDGRADLAFMHKPFDDLVGFDVEDLLTEGQVALLPARHPLSARRSLTLAEASAVPDLPIARWPRLDGTYPDGPGPQVRTQSQLAHLVALGRTLLVIPASSRAWQWPDHVAVPVVDAAEVTTVLAWQPGRRSPALAALVRCATDLRDGRLTDPVRPA